MKDDGFAQHVSRVSALADPIRRALYHFVSHQSDAVSRDQAAAGVDVPRHTAKFHLDKLVDEGLLITEFKRLTGRTGPGAGRPAKVYRRARREVSVSLPRRRYDLAGQMLADAVERALDGAPMSAALRGAADDAAGWIVDSWGVEDGDPAETMTALLTRLGYEPRVDGGVVCLGNCPFQQLSADHRGLICPLNRDFVEALSGRVAPELTVEPADPAGPAEGCCAHLR